MSKCLLLKNNQIYFYIEIIPIFFYYSVLQMDACNIILVSTVVLLLSIGVEPNIWGTKITEFASDKKKVFETFFYNAKVICISKWNSNWKFCKNSLWIWRQSHISKTQRCNHILVKFCFLTKSSFLVSKIRFDENPNIPQWMA